MDVLIITGKKKKKKEKKKYTVISVCNWEHSVLTTLPLTFVISNICALKVFNVSEIIHKKASNKNDQYK